MFSPSQFQFSLSFLRVAVLHFEFWSLQGLFNWIEIGDKWNETTFGGIWINRHALIQTGKI